MKHLWLRILGYGLAIITFVGCAYILSTVLTLENRLANGLYEEVTEKPFYTVPEALNGEPGQLIRSEKLSSAPNGMVGWRIMYYSTDIHGNTIAVTGLVAAPATRAEATKRTVVSWGHPTTGIAQRCAPSVGIDPFDSIEGLRDLVNAGYVVAATDYSGMGAAGPASFMIGKMEGQNVLDAARAAEQLPEANAGSDVVLWGHSQGGHAALFAEQMASTYAPDLTVKGVAVAAPATELGQLLKDNTNNVSDVTIGSYTMESYASAYNADITTVLTSEGAAATPTLAQYCLLGQSKPFHALARPLINKYFAKDPTSIEPWATLIEENTPGKAKIQAPLFVAQGETDTLIYPAVTQQFVDTQKALGASVEYKVVAKTDHALIAFRAMPDVMNWLSKLK